jgi:uncharacterized protein (TIGR02246 family)
VPIRKLVVAGLFILIAACDSNSGSGPDAAAQASDIIALEKRWSDMYAAGDLDGMSELFADDTVLLVLGEEPIVGRDAVVNATEAGLADTESKTTWVADKARVSAGGDMAYDHGTSTTVLPDGSTVEGRYLVVWIKEGDAWKVIAEMIQ